MGQSTLPRRLFLALIALIVLEFYDRYAPQRQTQVDHAEQVISKGEGATTVAAAADKSKSNLPEPLLDASDLAKVDAGEKASSRSAPLVSADVDLSSPASDSTQEGVFGFILVDVREDGILSPRIKALIERLFDISDLSVELWMSNNTTEPDKQLGPELTQLLDQRLFYRTMISNYTSGGYFIDMINARGGHIGKSYALKESRFDFPILFDGDVWPCNTNIMSVVKQAIERERKDVVWSRAPSPFGGSKDRNDLFVSPEIESQLEEYKQFYERNTGSVFAVNRKRALVRQMLQRAMEIFAQQAEGKPRIIRNFCHDQPALREAYFLYRHELSEHLLEDGMACRIFKVRKKGCPCASSTCDAVHGHKPFDVCAKLDHLGLK